MKWTNYRLGDLIEIKHGYAFSGTYITQEDNGIVLVTPGNFRIGGGFQEEKCKFFNGDVPEEYILRPGDLIVTMTDLSKNTDTLGYSALVPKSSRTYLHNQRIGLVKMKTDCVDYKFLYWLMRTHTYQRTIANSATGATVKHTSPTKIYEYQFNAPEKNVQKKIAGILSAYDDLIENNQKQIKLLEEAAMRLYKEWFVKLRFPGYENSKIVDGVPEGWRLGRVSELAEFKRGKTITKKNAKDGNVPVVAGGLEPAYFHNVANTVAPVITISASGANAGYTRLYNTDIWASDCSYIDASYGDKLYFIYTFLKNNKEVIDNLQRGAAQPHVYAKDINALSTYIPESTIMEPFCNLVAPLFKKIAVQERLISELKQARDKLLPKLMSGEIEV